ncbi:hypothetical protein ABG953_05890 [Enterococcus faecalis]
MSLLTEHLKKLGFFYAIEQELYIKDTGKYTSLIIEGTKEKHKSMYLYVFYKQTFYLHHPNTVTVYGEGLSTFYLIQRITKYLTNRKNYLEERNIIE